jgi:hypothetical protein
VFSNRRYHESGSKPDRLPNIRFLEDFNSDINDFSLAEAVTASMSFPGATEPVKLQYYKSGSSKSTREVRIVDGGVFDNSGLSTLLQVMQDQVILNNEKTKQEMVILLIDSDNEELNDFSERVSRNENKFALPIIFDWPIKGAGDALSSAMLIHTLNKRRLIKLALFNARAWLQSKSLGIKVTIIPISLSEVMDEYIKNNRCCEDTDIDCKDIRCENSDIRDNTISCKKPYENFGCAVKKIPTDFSISREDFWALDKAAYEILESPKIPCKRAINNFRQRISIRSEDGLDDFFPCSDGVDHSFSRTENDNKLLGEVIIEAFPKKGGGTPAEAMKMVEEAIAYIKANRQEKDFEKAYAEISNPNGMFVDRDLYITVYDMNGKCLAHGNNPGAIEKNLINLQDPDGKFLIKERIEMARIKKSGWQDYKHANPLTQKVEPKMYYFEKYGDIVVGCGAYKRDDSSLPLPDQE